MNALKLSRRLLLIYIVLGLAQAAEGATALAHLRAASPPSFRTGHTLPPLTRWGWLMPLEVRIELTEKWGYALEFGDADPMTVAKLNDPTSVPSKVCALAASNPAKYPLFVLAYRPCFEANFKNSLPASAWLFGDANLKHWSPEAPDSVFQLAGQWAAEPLRKVQAKAPVKIILHGGEDALGVYGSDATMFRADPNVAAAKYAMTGIVSNTVGWGPYISREKGRQEGLVADALRACAPKRTLYIYYFANGAPDRNRYWGWDCWSWDYAFMRRTSDLPNSSMYYTQFNTGFTGSIDMLSQVTNSAAQQIAAGDPLSYNWVCAGWNWSGDGNDYDRCAADANHSRFADLERYKGFLKCYYTAGMIGGIAGYFSYPRGGFSGDVGPTPPHWLKQMMVLSEVHATFSYLEDFLRQGDLLPGPNNHRWSTVKRTEPALVPQELPAYEFPTGDPTARVLVRKLRARNEWLITAWAADGPDRNVRVTIPQVGTVTIKATRDGALYKAGGLSLTRLDLATLKKRWTQERLR